jgi:hypothetical protein
MLPLIIFILTFIFLAVFGGNADTITNKPINTGNKMRNALTRKTAPIFAKKEEKLELVYKSDGTQVAPILRKTPGDDKPKKSVSFNDERTALVGNRLKVEKTFNKRTDL